MSVLAISREEKQANRLVCGTQQSKILAEIHRLQIKLLGAVHSCACSPKVTALAVNRGRGRREWR